VRAWSADYSGAYQFILSEAKDLWWRSVPSSQRTLLVADQNRGGTGDPSLPPHGPALRSG